MIREGSVTQESDDVEKRRRNVNDALFVIKRLNKLINEQPNCGWLLRMRSDLTIAVLNTTAAYLFPSRKIYMKELRKLHVFPLTSPYPEGTTKWKVFMLNFAPFLTIYIMHMSHEIRN